MDFTEYLKKQYSKPLVIISAYILVFLIGCVDYLTGEELSISIFYLLPIIFIAWFLNIRAGIFMSVASTAVWHITALMVSHNYSNTLISYWNSAIQFGFFLTIVIILSALKMEYIKREGLIAELKDALAELKRSKEELTQKTQELADSNEELERFAYVAAHDLKGPLTAVEGQVNRLRRRHKDKLDPDAEKIIGYALDGINSMKALINDLLSYARVGTKNEDFKAVNCNDIVSRAISNLQTDIAGKGALVTHDDLPDVLADNIQMTQLLQNLIGNAVKFCDDKTPRVHVSAKQKDGEWVFSVSDNGIGIDSKDAERIFNIFQRLHSNTEYPGTGIGLAICKKIAERHGGRIWVKSEPGKGSTFFFTIPPR
ncbi:MAG: GHKL domain-containing protein [Nitrospirae bacterium]|nr:GHKL domain-containing protein [Nitrospirota bacterium]